LKLPLANVTSACVFSHFPSIPAYINNAPEASTPQVRVKVKVKVSVCAHGGTAIQQTSAQ